MKNNLLTLKDIEISFDKTIIRNLNLEVSENDFVSIIGRSGIGKTSILNLILGNIINSKGQINFKQDVSKTIVFQEYNKSLFPWFTVYENLKIVVNNDEYKEIDNYLELVGLQKERYKYPWQMSGGMQQRLAIARALLLKPKLLLLDEPFGSLDNNLKEDLEEVISKLHKKMGITIICVTHDIESALFLSNKIYVMNDIENCIFNIIHSDFDDKNKIRTSILYSKLKLLTD